MQYENPSFGPPAPHHSVQLAVPTDLAPRNFPGYQPAVNAGIVQLPPAQPPTVLGGLSASKAVPFILAITAALALIAVTSRPDLATGVTFAAVTFGWWKFAGRWVERRVQAELAAGYITVPVMHLSAPGSAGWNYAGTWRMNRDNLVNAEPDRRHDAPGFYPSPVRPGQLQLWTGLTWQPEFRPMPVPFTPPRN